MKKEIWKDIENYRGIYQVSNLGRVKSLVRKRVLKERIFKLTSITNGYIGVCLHKNGIKIKRELVHRLVAKAFIPNPEDKPQVNHIDGVKTNNNLSNLEWNTRYENVQHAIRSGLSPKGSANARSILTESDIPKIFEMRSEGFLQRDIGDYFGVHKGTVNDILLRKSWSHIQI